MKIKSDNYENAVTGMGMPGTSKSRETRFRADRMLGEAELQDLYVNNGYAARIVDRMVDDCTRGAYSLTGLDKRFDWTSVKSRMDDLGAMRFIGDAWRWGRLYGTGLLVMAVDDGREPDEPLDLENARSLRGLSILDSTNTRVCGWNAAYGALAWSHPTGYQLIVPDGTQETGTVIHPSRVVRFDGCRVPPSIIAQYAGWAPSVLQRCNRQLAALGSVMESAQELVADLSVMVLNWAGLNEQLMSDEGASEVREILRQLRRGIDSFNILALDSTSTYQEVKRSVEGLEKLINAFERDLVSACGLPRIILTGEQASGLGASSGDEVRSWYSSCATEQTHTVAPAMNRILEVEFACRRNAGESVPSEWSIVFAPLTTPEPKASAEIAKTWADTVSVLIGNGTISAAQGTDLLVRNGVLEALPTDDQGEPLEAPEAVAGEQDPAADDEAELEPVSTDPVPPDAATAQEIAAELGVATIRVTRLVRQGLVRQWSRLGKLLISRAEIHAIIAAENSQDPEGTEP